MVIVGLAMFRAAGILAINSGIVFSFFFAGAFFSTGFSGSFTSGAVLEPLVSALPLPALGFLNYCGRNLNLNRF